MADTLVLDRDQEAPEHALVPQSEITSIVSARDAALKRMAEASDTLERAFGMSEEAADLRKLATGGETFSLNDRTKDEHYGRLFRGYYDRDKSLTLFRAELDASVWQHLFNRTGMFDMMDMTAKEEWRKTLMNDVPEVTLENIFATLETVGRDADLIFKRGLAKVFMKLDRRFRSHDGFKVGSRIILTNVFSEWGSFQWGPKRDMIADMERVMAKLDGQAPDPRGLYQAIEDSRGRGLNPRQSVTESKYFRIKGFMNGNAHLWFTRDDLVEKANKMLAEYYGELIPDGVPATSSEETFKSKAGLPSKDLQFYFTPEKAAEEFLRRAGIADGWRVLEPSAGEGHLVRKLFEMNPNAKIDALEIDAGRVAVLKTIRSANLRVQQCNFLQAKPNPVYNRVFMNPPFYGTHWMEHVSHAFEFLKPGGVLYAILPATAETGETSKHVAFRKWAEKYLDRWDKRMFFDLPQEAFAEAGTRINTVWIELHKPEEK